MTVIEQANSDTKVALAHGYTTENASIIISRGNIEANSNLGETQPATLMSDVAFDGENLWWTAYHERTVFVTDLHLNNTKTIELPEGSGPPVGIVYSDSINSIILPLRDYGVTLFVVNPTSGSGHTVEIRDTFDDDQYDVAVDDTTLYLVGRREGLVRTIDIQDLTHRGHAIPQILISNLNYPQHLQIYDGKGYLIETNRRSIFIFDVDRRTYCRTSLSSSAIRRGIAVTDDYVWLSGYGDLTNDESYTVLEIYDRGALCSPNLEIK